MNLEKIIFICAGKDEQARFKTCLYTTQWEEVSCAYLNCTKKCTKNYNNPCVEATVKYAIKSNTLD